MTIEERVDNICKWNNPGLRAVVLEAMRDAVADEREAILRIVVDVERACHTRRQSDGELAANSIAKVIRARGDEQ